MLDAEGRDRVETILRLAQRMNTLLDSLLEYARFGRDELRPTTFSLEQITAEVSELIAVRIAEAGATLQVHTPQQPLHGDLAGVRNVLANLISNAIKYHDGPAARIEVGTCRFSETRRGHEPPPAAGAVDPLVVYVRDDGIGIAANRFEAVFSIFRRLHPRDAYGGGTGVGLTIARRIIERHGGMLWVDRSVVGEGTTMCFTLPGS